MKELSKKILEAGLVEKHVAHMFERWGQLEPGAADLVGQRKVTELTLAAFADDIERLVEESSEAYAHETRLDINITNEFDFVDEAGKTIHAYVDYIGHVLVLVSQKPKLHRGSKIREGGKTHSILDIEPFYQNDEMVALQLTVSRPE